MKKVNLFLCVALFMGFTSCHPLDDLSVQEMDLVLTNYDKAANFSSVKTYAVSDSIIELFSKDKTTTDSLPDFISPSVSVPIVAAIDANMAALGYKKVKESDNPDATILLSIMQTTDIYYYYDYAYWGWYYPYYWYYPFPISYATVVNSGTLMIQMMSNKDISIDNRAPVIWLGVANGILEGSTSSINSRINSSINQAFNQSPYLKH